jgi:uncharacterized protein
VINFAKLVPFGMLGQLSTGNLQASLLLLPLAPLGVALGIWAQGKVKEMLFYRIAYVLLFITGVRLVCDGALRLLD